MKEFFEQFDKDAVFDMFQYGEVYGEFRDDNIFEVMSCEMSGYDEGMVYTTTVVKHIPSDRYFQYEHGSNSWAEYDEDFDLENIVEVKPVEKTITVYEPI